MRPGAFLALALTLVGLSAVVFAFLANASPYVTVAQAKSMEGDNLHVSGDIVPGTVKVNVQSHTVRFDLMDEHGDLIRVVYEGAPPANMGTATQVVAVGGHRAGEFQARRILLKCPSKYESEPGKAATPAAMTPGPGY